MALTLELQNPPAETPNHYLAVEQVLVQLRTQVEARYNQKILVMILTATEVSAEARETLRHYSVILNFANRHHFTYRLMELRCSLSGEFAVEVTAFADQPRSFGTAKTVAQLEEAVAAVIADRTTRNIILMNYNL